MDIRGNRRYKWKLQNFQLTFHYQHGTQGVNILYKFLANKGQEDSCK
jgi:hypothetical protein